ncbi:hypothetical protein ACFCWD_32785 [Streptomyces sp. NPDC056374]|uniref:hypothetical protein n=1 Tax=unclassified Streptomyces TaxID=2593676 RepID=UPI0035DA7AD5
MQNSTEQGSHIYVLTLQSQQKSVCTLSGTYTPPTGVTRFDILAQLRLDAARQYPSMEGGIVLYFALEPNTV